MDLTKRELFAVLVLAGICADGVHDSRSNPRDASMEAVAYADALLRALKETEEDQP